MHSLLFTSIPPRLEGIRFEPGRPESPQAVTIRSWIAAGFQPVSINVEREVAGRPWFERALGEHGVESVVLPDDPGGHDQGPLCPFSDFLRAIRDRAADAPAVIINADVRLAADPDRPLAKLVNELAVGEQAVAQRTDLAARVDGSPRQTVHRHGFDFLAFRGSWVERIQDFLVPALAFGLPWWDHYLPLALIACGCRTKLVHPDWCLHQAHVGGWSWRQYCRVGRLAMRHFEAALRRQSGASPSQGWLEMLDLETVPGGLTGPIGEHVRRIATHDAAPDVVAVHILARLAAANVRLVLQSATHGPYPSAMHHR
jgi:hypothetical protein